MELRIALPSLKSPFPVSASFAASLWHGRNFSGGGMNQKVVFEGVFLCPVRSRKVLRVQKFDKGGHSIRVSCRVNGDGGLGEEPFEFRDGLSLGSDGCCIMSEKNARGNGYGGKGANFPSRFDFLEPGMLGIVPEPPNWPEREKLLWARVEQRAKNFELPLSLRMIKKKQQREWGVRGLDLVDFNSPVRKAFSSMVSIIVGLQSYALQMREALCDEELESIVSKVQREMHLSFAWIFQQVFSKTPALMIHVMTLLADFGVYSASHNVAPIAGASLLGPVIQNPNVAPEELSWFPDQELSESEMLLWNSVVEEATKMGILEETTLGFVSPLSVEMEPDDRADYYRTDFLYQIMLSRDPLNPLLLCNYARFLQHVTHDYDRAEECFKRSLQVNPLDSEVLSLYATFLWRVRKDLTGAEDVFQQAIVAAPQGNTYYTSKYAGFLWSTGGEETCFPLN